MKLSFISLLALFATTALACPDHNLPDASSVIQVVDTSVSTTKMDGQIFVTVLGSLKNSTRNRVDDLVVEAKLIDRHGKVVDVLSENVYGIVVPAGEQVAFRLQAPAAASQDSYVGVQARVVSAEAHAPAAPQKQNSWFTDLLTSWGPMMIFIAVWIILARRYSGKKSIQGKLLTATEEQNELLKRQIAAIEAIASAANSRQQRSET